MKNEKLIKQKYNQIFKKIVRTDVKSQEILRRLWLENELTCVDSIYGSERKKRIRNKAKKLTPLQLAKYGITYYDSSFDILNKKAFKNLTKKEQEFVENYINEQLGSYI